MTNLNFAFYRRGRIKEIRICHRRRFFKSFAVIQVRREQLQIDPIPRLRRGEPEVDVVVGLYQWTDVDPNDLTEVKDVMNLLEKVNAQEQTK